MLNHQKVTTGHLSRKACLYVRQSTMRQVIENTESTHRQYALRERAMALGWPSEGIHVIDCDLGLSGADRDREGFNRLVAEVSMGRVGIVLGLEVSRLARNSTDWHRLLEICGQTRTLILDEDGIYDPCDFNDRLLMGLKGTMSEAELHMLKIRLQGGLMNKARRGTLKIPLPVGLVYDPLDRIVVDPDSHVRNSVQLLFDTFHRIGSATATVKFFTEEGIEFPSYPRFGPNRGTLCWLPLVTSRVLQILHNPLYAGAFAYGRSARLRTPNGYIIRRQKPKDWTVLIREAHPGFISWEQYEANQERLLANARSYGAHRRCAPREGPALLQSMVVCGLCGKNMTVRYHTHNKRLIPTYVCQREGIETATRICQSIPGKGIDQAIGDLLIELMTPDSLEVALQVQQELERQAEEVDAWRSRKVQCAREEADLARQRFMQTHPDNRIVADVLEAEWNDKLRNLDQARQELEDQRKHQSTNLGDLQRQRVLDLATNFPRLWNDPATPDRERKRMVRLIIEDVTLTKGDTLVLGVRFRGGATRQVMLAPEKQAWEKYKTPPEAVTEIDRLLETHIERDIATILNDRGFRTGHGLPFRKTIVRRIRLAYGLKSRFDRLRARGLLTKEELGQRLNIAPSLVKSWRRKGLLVAHAYTARNDYLYEIPVNPPVKNSHKFGRKTAPSVTKTIATCPSPC